MTPRPDESLLREVVAKHGTRAKKFIRWWEPRRPGEITTEFLGRVIDAAGQSELAKRAREGHFDDYFCPSDIADGLETVRLVYELDRAASAPKTGRGDRTKLRALIEGVKAGEFDGTKAEGDRWAASADGQRAHQALLESLERRRG